MGGDGWWPKAAWEARQPLPFRPPPSWAVPKFRTHKVHRTSCLSSKTKTLLPFAPSGIHSPYAFSLCLIDSTLTDHTTKKFRDAASRDFESHTGRWTLSTRSSVPDSALPEHQPARKKVHCCKSAACNRFVPNSLMLRDPREKTNHSHLAHFSDQNLIIATSDELS